MRLLPSVLHALIARRYHQEKQREVAGEAWIESGFVFTNEKGAPIDRHTLTYRHFRPILKEAGNAVTGGRDPRLRS